jgi:hypothetical protein
VKLSRIGVAALCAAALLALPSIASAAPTTNTNSCQYYYDSLWRDMDVSMDGVVSAGAGAAMTVASPTVNVSLPEWLVKYGFDFGILKGGYNEIPVEVWFATRGTNTTEGTRILNFETLANTDITASGDIFVDATPIEYNVPALPAQTWTRRGGPVQLRQAGGGSLPPLPIGPGGRLQQPKGSLVISAHIGPVTITLDCMPGRSIGQGSDFVEATPAPFGVVDAPALSCLSALPTGGVRMEMADERVLANFSAGAGYSYAPAVSYRLTNAYLRSLFDAGRLAVGDNSLALSFTAAVDGRGVRSVLSGPPVGPVTVRVGPGGTPIRVFAVNGGTITESDDLAGLARLAAWTGPAGSTPLGFTLGGIDSLAVDGVSGPVKPYGPLYARATITPAGRGAVNGLSYDCVSGTVTVNDAVAYSELGNQPGGDQGRYAIAGYPLDPFAIAYHEPVVEPRPTVTATPTAVITPVPTVAPAPAPPESAPLKAGKAGVASKSLKLKANRVSASLSCTGATTCRGTVKLRSAKKVKKKFVVLTKSVKYTVRAGKKATVRLKLSGTGTKYVRGKKRISVVLDVKPASGKTVSKKLTLSR